MCDFCDNNIYDNRSNYDDWTIVMSKDFVSYWIDIDHKTDLGCGGTLTHSISFKVNYCPFCGERLEKNENV